MKSQIIKNTDGFTQITIHNHSRRERVANALAAALRAIKAMESINPFSIKKEGGGANDSTDLRSGKNGQRR